MDEQTIQQQAEVTSPEPEAPLPEGTEPEVSIDDNGEVQFREDFFGDVKDEPDPEEADEPSPEAYQPPQVPAYYTAEELKATPYEEWDINRLPEQFREYANIVRGQLEQRRSQAQVQAQIEQRTSELPPNYVAPKQYTPKELAYEAQRMAMQALGITDADEWDDYEPEHRAALEMAMTELAQKDYVARQEYARVSREYQDLQRFNAQMTSRPDYADFNRWFDARMKAEGLTGEQIRAALQAAVDVGRGNNWSAVQNAVGNWYREYQASKQQPVRRQRTQRPPVLESTSSGYEGSRSMDLRKFGELDMDGQAQALMNMGIV